ncbi:MAG: response regulator, partial [Deltaproteobacteria bacterium]
GDGEEALRIAGEFKGEIDLLLTDVVMPRMGGPELFERIRRWRPGIEVLYMSGYTDDAIVHQGVLDAGIAFLQKPYSPVSLLRKVKALLEEN